MLQKFAYSLWYEDQGALSWEWVMITTLLVLGAITGLAAARDAVIDEMGDIAQGFVAIDQSYTIDFPLGISIDGESTGSSNTSNYRDAAVYSDCGRSGVLGQGAQFDNG